MTSKIKSDYPCVSICLPTLNARLFLEPRMETILSQTLTDWELIVCDSFSDDGTWEHLQQFKSDPRVRLYQVPKDGLYAGWNECLRRCRGEYVYIATADDTCSPDLLEKMVDALERVERRAESVEGERAEGEKLRSELASNRLESTTARSTATGNAEIRDGEQKSETYNAGDIKHKERKDHKDVLTAEGGRRQNFRTQVSSLSPSSRRPIDICVCNYDVIDADGKILNDHPAGRWPRRFYGAWMRVPHIRDGRTEFLLHSSLGIMWWSITAVVFRRQLIDQIGYFRRDRGANADEEWEMRAALASDIVYLPLSLATWRVHESQATAHLPPINRVVLDSLESILDDPDSGVPNEWRAIPGWRSLVLKQARSEFRDSLNLYRGVLRRSACKFVTGLLFAAKYEPRHLVRQILNGFSWKPEYSIDVGTHALNLISSFKSAWPPRIVDENEPDL